MANDLFLRASGYCNNKDMRLIREPVLGHGTDGSVWKTSDDTAVKAVFLRKNYTDELECYRRLAARKLSEIDGLAVPILECFDSDLMIVEMTIVQPPYLLDFGKVYLDEPPPYEDDELRMDQWHADIRELFEDNASRVYKVMSILKGMGIHYVDPKPANIQFRSRHDRRQK